MTEATIMSVRIIAETGADAEEDEEELGRLTRRLRSELLDLDVSDVEPVPREEEEVAKGAAEVLGWLVVHLGVEQLGEVVGKLAQWALSYGRTVEVNLDGDVLKLGRATREQQEGAYQAWLARHTPGN